MSKSKFSGYTFIEVLVSVAVIFIIVSVTFAGYARLNQRQTLISAGQTLKNILRDAQSRAYTGEVDCSVCNCNVGASLNSVGWYADFAAPTPMIFGNCGDNIDFSVKNFGLPNGIMVNASPVTKILFRSRPLGVDNPVTVCLTLNNLTNNYYKITVGPSGEISDSGGLVDTCP
ncbi:hypothetical protein HY338_03525 [Candidatus Gottesmanbacteria bacterium]|nr:hypothetical protein [Candidatus Gottesmanbacteria bacterium]